MRNVVLQAARPALYKASKIIKHGQPVSLNPDHTHFLLVDDGYRNRYGGVADLRARLERRLVELRAADSMAGQIYCHNIAVSQIR